MKTFRFTIYDVRPFGKLRPGCTMYDFLHSIKYYTLYIAQPGLSLPKGRTSYIINHTSCIVNLTGLLFLVLLLQSCSSEDVPWEALKTQGGAPIYDLYFVSADTAFAVGGVDYESEKILRSTNGGLSWDSLPPYYGQAILGVDFFDRLHGFTAGIAGKILRTEDGGRSWWIYTMDFYNNLHAVSVLSERTVLAVGGGSRGEGEIWRSTDGAASWSVDTFDFELLDLVFVDERVGYACGYGAVLKTVDAGQSWRQLDVDGDLFGSISFPHPDTGYVVGRTGHIARTLDGGEHWETMRSASAFVQDRHKYHSVVFRDGQSGYIVGKNSLILYTEDAGKKWKPLSKTISMLLAFRPTERFGSQANEGKSLD